MSDVDNFVDTLRFYVRRYEEWFKSTRTKFLTRFQEADPGRPLPPPDFPDLDFEGIRIGLRFYLATVRWLAESGIREYRPREPTAFRLVNNFNNRSVMKPLARKPPITVEIPNATSNRTFRCVLRRLDRVNHGILAEMNGYLVFAGDPLKIVEVFWKTIENMVMRWDSSLEIYLQSGKSYLFEFEDSASRESFLKLMRSNQKIVQKLRVFDQDAIFKAQEFDLQWNRREISNFAFLMWVNMLNGRSFHDLEHYPVFPSLFSDFHVDKINLKTTTSFRNLSKLPTVPTFSAETVRRSLTAIAPWHSTPVTDSIFSLTAESIGVVPEFFTCPASVAQFTLPRWAPNEYRYCVISRRVLESSYVTRFLSNWISRFFPSLQVAVDNVGIPRGLSLDFKNFLSSEALILFMAVSRGFYILTEDGILSTRESVNEQATRTVTLSFMRNTKLERGKCLILPEVGIVLFVPHNGNYFVSVLYNSESQESNAFLPTSPRYTGPITHMASDNAGHVAVVSVDGSIVIYWFCNTMICVTSVIAIHKKSVRAVAISKFFGIVVAADNEGGLSISRVETGRPIVWQIFPGLAVKKILITKSGFLVFVTETAVQLRDMRLALIGEEDMRCDAACLVELPGDRRFLAVAQETTVALWRLCPFKLKKAAQVPYRIRELIYAEMEKKLICIIGSEDEHSRIVIASDLIATG
jgi:hypothetical protein